MDSDLEAVKQNVKKLEKTLKNRVNSTVNSMALSSQEKKLIKEYSSELLHPTRGIDLPRPFPVKTYKGFYSGQLTLNSDYREVMFQIKPDPFKFVKIFENNPSVINGTGRLPEINYAEAGADDLGNVRQPGVCDIIFGYPLPVPLVNDTSLPNTHHTVAASYGAIATSEFVALINDNFRGGFVNGWLEATIAGPTFQCTFTNNSQATLDYAPIFMTRDATGAVSPLGIYAAQTIAPGVTQTWTPTAISTTTVTGKTLLCCGIRLTNVINAPFGYEQMRVSFSAQINGNADHLSERVLSLGAASYPNDPVNALRLDQMFVNCQLYAPVACSTVLNVVQTLKDRGGNFLSAYLPSRVNLPDSPSAAWEVAKAYGRSYPVVSNPFAKGAHASWVGQRIQDYEFRRPFREDNWKDLNYDSLPSTYLIAQRAISGDVSTATFYLDFSVAFSVQTLDPTITLTMTPSCPEFCVLYLSLVAMHPHLVGENPDHLHRIAELAKIVANDPRTAQILKFGFSKVLPVLLGALA